ncbi:MAG: DUF3325 domain-containing protein [Psychrobium sp.]|nr:DUF3325 domain-containing protein [Psychrobium sp.]
MILSYLLQLFALWLLSMAMNKHFRHSFKRTLSIRHAQMLSKFGWLLLAASFACLVNNELAPLMSVYWLSFLALNILLVALFNSWQSRHKIKRLAANSQGAVV